MPSIAQQDYLRPSGKALTDCHLLAALAHNIQQGTIFDTIMTVVTLGETDQIRPYSVDSAGYIYLYYPYDAEAVSIQITYTQTQYEGLAAIQDTAGGYYDIPVLALRGGYLAEDVVLDDELTIGGKKIAATVKDGHLVNIAISEVEYNGTEISWEDAQKLIGVRCVDND